MDELPDKSTQEIASPHARLIPVSGKSVAVIQKAGGMDNVCSMILDGRTQREIAELLKIPRSDLASWICNERDPRYAAAMQASAETCLDQAQAVLEGAELTMPAVGIARELAGLWRHRAGVRNWRYGAKGIAEAPALPAQPPTISIRFIPALKREVTIEGETSPDLYDED